MKIEALKINLTEKEKNKILEDWKKVLSSGVKWTNSDFVQKFEEKMQKKYRTKYSIATSTGSTGIISTLIALNIKQESIIYCPILTAPPTILSVLEVGAKVVYVDCLDDFGMDPVDLEKKIKIYGTNGAIIPVHVGGIISDKINDIIEIGKIYNLPIVEDCAHAHGSELYGKPAGTFGDAGVFSFFLTKTLTSGEGGIVVTNNEKINHKIRMIRNYGKNEFGVHECRGSSWRMNEFTAVVALNQLNNQDEIINEKSKIAKRYDDYFGKSLILKKCNFLSKSGFYKYILRTFKNINIKGIEKKLLENFRIKLPARVYERLCNEEAYLKNHLNILNSQDFFKNASIIRDSHLCLPIYRGLLYEEIEYICKSLTKVFKEEISEI